MSAAIPDSGGVINGCWTARTGALRVIDTAVAGSACTSKESPISWSQRGPAGDPGPSGAPGVDGAPGADGADGTTPATYFRRASASSGASTVTVTCDPGDVLTGGGANTDGTLVDSNPFAYVAPGEFVPQNPDVPFGWFVSKSGGSQATAYAICSDTAP